MAEETKKIIHHEYSQPVKIHLYKTSSGYNWEIHASGETVAEILPIIREANRKLAAEYGGKK